MGKIRNIIGNFGQSASLGAGLASTFCAITIGTLSIMDGQDPVDGSAGAPFLASLGGMGISMCTLLMSSAISDKEEDSKITKTGMSVGAVAGVAAIIYMALLLRQDYGHGSGYHTAPDNNYEIQEPK